MEYYGVQREQELSFRGVFRLGASGGLTLLAAEFDQRMAGLITADDDAGVVDFLSMGPIARLAHPTHDHFLPLIYALGLRGQRDAIEYFNDEVVDVFGLDAFDRGATCLSRIWLVQRYR